MTKDSVRIDVNKVEYKSRFDGKWVLTTNTDFSAEKTAFKYKELWQSDIKQDLKALQLVTIEERSKRFVIRSRRRGNCGKIFQAVKVALPPTIRKTI